MKILLLITLSVCACANAAFTVQDEILPLVSSSSNDLRHLNVELELRPKSAIAEDGQIIPSLLKIQQRNVVADTIQNTLEGFRDVVINGNEDLPPLDPYVIEKLGPFDYSTNGVRASVNINNFRMEGFRWYVVDYVTFNALRLTLGLHTTIPFLTFTGSYDAEARLALLLTHRAGGNFRIFLNRIEVGVDIRMGTNLLGGHLLLRELDINIDIHDTHINVQGMTGSSLINNFINSFVQSVTQDLVQSEMKRVSEILSEELFDVINDVLKDYTLNDLLG